MSTVDIRPDHADIVHKILQKFVPERSVWVFGSRAKWLAKEYSDLDLCIIGDTPLSFVTLGLLDEAFEDSDLPYKVDCIDWATTSPEFRKIIARDKVVFQKGQNKEMQNHLKQGWIETTLGAVVDIIGGGTPKRDKDEYWNGDIPWISVVDFNNDNRFIDNTKEKITLMGLKNSSTKLLEQNYIIISARGTVGCLAQLTKPMAFNQSCYGLTGKPNLIENNFLYYLVKYKVNELKQNVHGAVFDTITRETFYHIPVEIPKLPYQKKISEILGDLDDKIAINNQINKTLETMAQALFKSWFVDFDPVYAKKHILESGRTEDDATLAAMAVISGKSDAELGEFKTGNPQAYNELAHTASLFPSDLQDSELGRIPVGWGISDLEEEFIITMGQSPKGETYNTEKKGIIFFQGRAEFKNRFPEPRLYTTDPKRFAEKGSVLMSVRAPVGDLNIALDKCCIGRGLASLLHKSNSTSYSYCLLKQLQPVLNNYNGEGTVFGSINQKDLKSIQIIKPKNDLVVIFNNKVGDFDSIIRVNEIQSQTLSQIRDSLLPKLLSGEIDVNNKGY